MRLTNWPPRIAFITSSAGVVRRVAARRQMADAQLGLRGAFARNDREPTGDRFARIDIGRRRTATCEARSWSPSSRRTPRSAIVDELSVRQRTGHDQRRAPRQIRRRVKSNDLISVERAQRRVGADRQMSVGM